VSFVHVPRVDSLREGAQETSFVDLVKLVLALLLLVVKQSFYADLIRALLAIHVHE